MSAEKQFLVNTSSVPMVVTVSSFANNGTVELEKHRSTNIYLDVFYGVLSIASLSLLPLLALLIRPIANKPIYKSILLFLMSMGVGILSATSLLFLLPEALGLDLTTDDAKITFTYKMALYFGTVVFFLNFEIVFKKGVTFMAKKKLKRKRKHRQHFTEASGDETTSIMSKIKQPVGASQDGMNDRHRVMQTMALPDGGGTELSLKSFPLPAAPSSRTVSLYSINSAMGISAVTAAAGAMPPAGHGDENASLLGSMLNTGALSSVVWIVLTGDSIHNFVDGVTIGSTIARSLIEGLSMALVILVEETPHKLGDVAVLLGSGVSNGRAVLYCILATLPCYIGYFVGVLVGNVLAVAVPWIYTLAAALFLYSAIADILPEVVERINSCSVSNQNSSGKGRWSRNRSFVVKLITANVGLCFGFTVAAILSVYASSISIS